jgi:uncharacterized Zn-finger protein
MSDPLLPLSDPPPMIQEHSKVFKEMGKSKFKACGQ